MSYNSSVYNKDYYKSHCGDCYERGHGWEEVFGRQAERIIKELSPKSVLDVGCAAGYLVEGLRDRGVEAYGIDISDYAIGLVRDDIKEYCKVKSATEKINGKYDLITCIEVLEHLSPADISSAIDNICGATDMIIFSSTPFDYNEESHYSVNPTSFWAEKFAYNGFFHDISYDCSYIAVQTMLFKRVNCTNIELIRTYEDKLFLLWQENCILRDNVNLANARIGDLDRGNIQHAQEMEKIRYELDLANARIGDLDRGNIQHAQEVERNKERFRYLLSKELKKRENLNNKILFFRDRTDFLENELYMGKMENDKLIKELEQSKTERIQIKDSLDNLSEELRKKNEECEYLKVQNQGIKNENQNIKDENQRIRDENQSIKSENQKRWNELIKYKRSKLISKVYTVSRKWKRLKTKFGKYSNRALLKKGIDYWQPVFNAEDYCDYNSDISEEIGFDEWKLLRHFVYYGMAERRRASKIFDIDAYCKYNPDIELEFGDDIQAIYLHYIENGKKENRRALE